MIRRSLTFVQLQCFVIEKVVDFIIINLEISKIYYKVQLTEMDGRLRLRAKRADSVAPTYLVILFFLLLNKVEDLCDHTRQQTCKI
jgi:hypothetical protein